MIPRLNLFENENEVYFQKDGAPPHFHVNVRNFLNSTFYHWWIGQRGSSMEFLPRSSDLTLLNFYIWGTLKNSVHHKTTNTGGTERSDWTYQWYSISNNPDHMLLCLTSLLGVYCGRRWTFEHVWASGSLRNRTQHKLYIWLISLLRNNVSKSVYINLRHSVLYQHTRYWLACLSSQKFWV